MLWVHRTAFEISRPRCVRGLSCWPLHKPFPVSRVEEGGWASSSPMILPKLGVLRAGTQAIRADPGASGPSYHAPLQHHGAFPAAWPAGSSQAWLDLSTPPPPGPLCSPHWCTSYPAPQQLVGRDAQGPPVNGVRIPRASIHIPLEHFWGCRRQDKENVTARHSLHSPALSQGTRGQEPSLSNGKASTPSTVPWGSCCV